MSATEHWFPGRLTEMSAGECRDLMGSTSVGRVGFVDEDGPVVLPVNYVLDGSTVLFRTSPHNSLARHLDSAVVAFEVDEFDDFTQSGWSVLVRGSRPSSLPRTCPGTRRSARSLGPTGSGRCSSGSPRDRSPAGGCFPAEARRARLSRRSGADHSNLVPCGSSLRSRTVPPWSAARRRTLRRPLSRRSAGIPLPLSVTLSTTRSGVTSTSTTAADASA